MPHRSLCPAAQMGGGGVIGVIGMTDGGAGSAGQPASPTPPSRSAVLAPALLAGLVAVGLGSIVLIGWVGGSHTLRAFLPGAPPMKANAAFLVVLLGAAIAMHAAFGRTRLVDALAIIVAIVAAATIYEYATGVDFGIDRLLAADVAQPDAPHPGRMALSTAVALAAGSLALLFLGNPRRGWRANTGFALAVALVGATGTLGYLYGARQLATIGSATQIAFPTSVALLGVSAGLIAADPHHGLMRLLRDPGLAGQLTRRLVPTTVLVLPFAGWLELELVKAGFLDDRIGSAATVALEVLVLGAVGVWTANGVLRLERARAETQRERDRAQAGLTHQAEELQLTNRRLQDALAEARRFGEALDHVSSYIYMKNARREYVYANRAMLDLFQCSAQDLPGSSDARFFPPDTLAHLKAVDDRVLEKGETSAEEIEVTDGAGNRHVYWETKTRLNDTGNAGEVWGLIGISTDITERKKIEEAVHRLNEELEHRAMRDPLTGLANRRLLDELLAASLNRVARSGEPVQVAYLDLDGFKAVNDLYGHAAGDTVLREMSARLKAAVRAGDIVARVGGDEFVIILQPAIDAADQFRARIETSLSAPIDLGEGVNLICRASVGLADSRQSGTNPAQLLHAADAAMYGRKNGALPARPPSTPARPE